MHKVRLARETDARAIQKLIRQVRINPLGIDWHRFLLAVDEGDRVIGCGQIKPHADGTRELASIAVVPERQHQGIGTEIITRLVENEPLPLYLTCRSTIGPYYHRFGFRQAGFEALPPYFNRIWYLARFLQRLFPKMGVMWVMVKE